MHRTTNRFWECFGNLPESVQRIAKRKFGIFSIICGKVGGHPRVHYTSVSLAEESETYRCAKISGSAGKPHVLKAIAGSLDGTLYAVLIEWVESGKVEKLRGAAAILREFDEGNAFYNVSLEIIRRADDRKALGEVEGAIGSTPGIISGLISS